MRFTDWFLKQLCSHRDDNTGFSTFMVWHIDSKRIIRCTRCALQFDVSEVVWERWLREKK